MQADITQMSSENSKTKIFSEKSNENKNLKEIKDIKNPIAKKYKVILSKIANSSLNISDNISWKKDFEGKNTGWVYFSVDMSDLGMTLNDFRHKTSKDYGREIFSNYMIDFIGELLIRSNIEKIITFVFSIDENEYLHLVSREKHKRFGAEIDAENKRLILSFHCSILQTILTEDFKHFPLS